MSDTSESDVSDGGGPDFRAWKNLFTAALDGVKSFGVFAHKSSVSSFVNPGLTIDDSTSIPLPLISRDAEVIRSRCRQAPFGRGDETVVDTEVRKTWELSGDRFKFVNPAWPAYFEDLLKEVSMKLGTGPLCAEPYKLLLYDPGSFFKRHKDSEKSPGMIATLVICLPSAHEGGEVHLSHAGESVVFDTSKGAAYDLSAMAWFSDVTHEIKPVTSGHRLVLTYNLTTQKLQAPIKGRVRSAESMRGQQSGLRTMLKLWTSDFSHAAEKLVCPLAHKYSQTSLSMQNLKGADRARIASLADACRHSGCYLLLGNITFTAYEEDDYEDGEDELALDFWVTGEGKKLDFPDNVRLPELLGPGYYEGRYPDSEDEGDYTGNESQPSESRYHDSAAIVIPRKVFGDMLGGRMYYGNETNHVIARFLESDLNENGGDETVFKHVRLALARLLTRERKYQSNEVLASVIATALRVCRHHPHGQLEQAAMERVGPLLAALDPSSELAKELAVRLNSLTDCTEEQWSSHFTPAILHVPGGALAKSFAMLECLIQSTETQKSFRAWFPTVEKSLLLLKPGLNISDHPDLTKVIQSSDVVWIQEKLIPSVIRNADRELTITLLQDLGQSPLEPLSTNKLIIQKLLGGRIHKLCLRHSDFDGPYKPGMSRGAYLAAFANVLFSTADASGVLPEVEELVRKSSNTLTDPISIMARPPKLGNYTRNEPYQHPSATQAQEAINFVQHAADRLPKGNWQLPPAQMQTIRTLLVAVLWRHIFWHLPERPPQQLDWVYKRLQPCTCYGCDLCSRLNSFLSTPFQQIWNYSQGAQNIQHLQKEISRRPEVLEVSLGWDGPRKQLTVRKRQPECPEYYHDLQAWLLLTRSFASSMGKLHTDNVRLLLGDELYDELVLLKTVQDGGRHPSKVMKPSQTAEVLLDSTEQGASSAPLEATQARAAPITAPAQGVKRSAADGLENEATRRRVEVVDLLSD